MTKREFENKLLTLGFTQCKPDDRDHFKYTYNDEYYILLEILGSSYGSYTLKLLYCTPSFHIINHKNFYSFEDVLRFIDD